MMIADDLFAGAGGWDVAAERLGIHARGVENMKEARATREAAGLTTIHDDVWTFEPDGNAEGLIASPPCQTFSQAGKGNGRKALDLVLAAIAHGSWKNIEELRSLGESVGDERTSLVLTPLHFAYRTRPEWIAFEQVPTVLPVWEVCAAVLEGLGYSTWTGNLQAEMYGVPQTRKRAFLLARLDGKVAPPVPTHSRYYNRTPERLDEGVKKWVSMAEALGWVEDGLMVSNYGSGGDAKKRGIRLFTDPAPTVTSKIDRNVLYVNEGGEQYVRPDFIRMTKMANSARRHLDEPAPTIAFGHDAASCRWFADSEPVARITVQEAGTLQSFPAGHPRSGGVGKQFLQCGNAVPPLLAEAVLAAVA